MKCKAHHHLIATFVLFYIIQYSISSSSYIMIPKSNEANASSLGRVLSPSFETFRSCIALLHIMGIDIFKFCDFFNLSRASCAPFCYVPGCRVCMCIISYDVPCIHYVAWWQFTIPNHANKKKVTHNSSSAFPSRACHSNPAVPEKIKNKQNK